MNVSVVGLGKLGAPLVAVLGSRGHRVVGVDVNERSVQLVNDGRAPVFEPGLEELLQASRSLISATTDCGRAVAETEVTFIIVPTPSDEQGGFSLTFVLSAAEAIGRALREKHAYHVVVLTSTVLPGATEGAVLPTLERSSGKRCGADFGLCYNPEFIALGSVIRDMLNPDMLLIGESDSRAGDLLASIYATTCVNQPPIRRMNFVNAELTKIAVNAYVTTKISYANMLADICERLPGADVEAVTGALGLDSRIGRKYLSGATGYGGPCFPRDNLAIAYLARQLGTRALLAEATHQVNSNQISRLSEVVLSRLPPGGRVAVLGLSYKPHTDVIEEAPGIDLVRTLLAAGVPVSVYDPAAMENARRALGDAVAYSASAAACMAQAEVTVITTPWPEFADLTPSHLRRDNGRPTVIDCWRVLDRGSFERSADYFLVGIGAVAPAAERPVLGKTKAQART